MHAGPFLSVGTGMKAASKDSLTAKGIGLCKETTSLFERRPVRMGFFV